MSGRNHNFNDPHYLSQVLQMLSANDTETIRQGEKALKGFIKQSASIIPLLGQIKESPDTQIRHQAALLLKKKIGSHYIKLDTASQSFIKEQILLIMRGETVKVVSVAIAGCVSALAKGIFSVGGAWNELFSLLMELAQSPHEALRILNYSLLEQLSEQISEQLKPHTPTLVQMFMAGCQDSSHIVAVASMRATTAYIQALSNTEEVLQLKSLITPVMDVLAACLQRGDEDAVGRGLEIIQECTTMEKPLVNDHIEIIVTFLLVILQNDDVEAPVKQSAGTTLIGIMECRPKLVAKKNLVIPVLTALTSIIANADTSSAGSLFSFAETDGRLDRGQGGDEDEDDEDDEEYGEMDVQKIAQSCIDTMAINIPSKHFVEPALTLCAQGMQSPDPKMRKAGCALLGIIAEGCCDAIRQMLPMIVPPLLVAVQDPEFYVRECACFSLGQFSEHCQPDILHYHQQVLPVIFQALDDPKSTVQETSCYVLEMFCENLQPETLRPFLAPLLSRLAALLQNPKTITQEMALSAIAATAIAAEIEFLPYAEAICGILGQKLFATDHPLLNVRGRSLECLGHIAVAIKSDNFARYFETGMQSAVQGIAIDDDELKEFSYIFFANVSKVMERAFDPYLPNLMPHLKEVISQTELVFDDEEDEQADGDEPEEDDDDDGNIRINGADGFVNNKKAALTAIGSIAENLKEGFYPYLEDILQTVVADGQGALFSYHEIIRGEALAIMQGFVVSVCAAHNITSAVSGNSAPAKGELLPLPPVVHNVCKLCMQTCVKALEEDEDKFPVSQACESITAILGRVGIAALSLTGDDHGVLGDRLIKSIHTLLQEKAPCQAMSRVDAEEDDDDDHDNIVMDAVTDTIGAIAKCMGANFIAYFDMLLPPLMKFMKESRPYTDRAMVLGCFAESLDEIGPASVKYLNTALPLLQVSLADPMEAVRRNASYFVGVIVSAAGQALSPRYLELLHWLHPLCTRPASQTSADSGGADVDNALSAVAKMIRIAPDVIPLTHVLPVMLKSLPLRSDMIEGPSVYGCLMELLVASNVVAITNFSLIVSALAETLRPGSKHLEEVQVKVVAFFKHIASAHAHKDLFSQAVAGVSDAELQKVISDAVSA